MYKINLVILIGFDSFRLGRKIAASVSFIHEQLLSVRNPYYLSGSGLSCQPGGKLRYNKKLNNADH